MSAVIADCVDIDDTQQTKSESDSLVEEDLESDSNLKCEKQDESNSVSSSKTSSIKTNQHDVELNSPVPNGFQNGPSSRDVEEYDNSIESLDTNQSSYQNDVGESDIPFNGEESNSRSNKSLQKPSEADSVSMDRSNDSEIASVSKTDDSNLITENSFKFNDSNTSNEHCNESTINNIESDENDSIPVPIDPHTADGNDHCNENTINNLDSDENDSITIPVDGDGNTPDDSNTTPTDRLIPSENESFTTPVNGQTLDENDSNTTPVDDQLPNGSVTSRIVQHGDKTESSDDSAITTRMDESIIDEKVEITTNFVKDNSPNKYSISLKGDNICLSSDKADSSESIDEKVEITTNFVKDKSPNKYSISLKGDNICFSSYGPSSSLVKKDSPEEKSAESTLNSDSSSSESDLETSHSAAENAEDDLSCQQNKDFGDTTDDEAINIRHDEDSVDEKVKTADDEAINTSRHEDSVDEKIKSPVNSILNNSEKSENADETLYNENKEFNDSTDDDDDVLSNDEDVHSIEDKVKSPVNCISNNFDEVEKETTIEECSISRINNETTENNHCAGGGNNTADLTGSDGQRGPDLRENKFSEDVSIADELKLQQEKSELEELIDSSKNNISLDVPKSLVKDSRVDCTDKTSDLEQRSELDELIDSSKNQISLNVPQALVGPPQSQNDASETNSMEKGDKPPNFSDHEEMELDHCSEDSSPGRLRIDAEDDFKSPQLSDDEPDPNALTIDTTGMDPEPEPERKPVKETSMSTNIDFTIDNVAKGLTDLPTERTLPPLRIRKSPVKKVKRTRASRFAPTMGKVVKRRQISSMLSCPRCPMSSFNTVTGLLEHQRICGSASPSVPPPGMSEVQKAPRKVYMCSACGSYFENWNLFLHMKEMHKRHICLHCLGMFSQAGKLAQHLAIKHHIMEQSFISGDELSVVHPGPQFLLCCRCDRMCSEKDFESHSCSTVCSHCGLAGTHYPTCRLAPPPPIRPLKLQKRRSRGPRRPRDPPASTSQPTQDVGLASGENGPPPVSSAEQHRVKMQDRPVSSLQSIEESINRVVESACVEEEEEVVQEEEAKVESSPPRVPTPEPPVEESPPAVSPPRVEEEKEPEPEPQEEPQQEEPMEEDAPAETRSDSDSSASDKLTIELNPRARIRREPDPEPAEVAMVMAGEETPFTHVPLPDPLDVPRVPTAMKLFVRSTALNCVYCAHARKIAVNGKQLGLHLLAQHRHVTVAESMPNPDKLQSHSIVVRCIREALPTLESMFFNAYGFDSSDKSAWRSADRVYECFHCCYSTPDSKEFLSHNRKIHQNASHLCIMCKSRFLTYSELLCHLCVGVYVPGRIIDPHLRYRCYACDIDPLPSSFQLMVHLRQVHTSCDMCFAVCDSQLALSGHVPKHKFHFYCYACGLTYRTRQDVSKHIFWKHGAESVTCKRCLQKKWRHAYHFCLPAPGFACETCNGWFKTASALRVHQRLHQGVYPHGCTECSEKFISKKLLAKHVVARHEPAPVNGSSSPPTLEKKEKKEKKKKKEVHDVFDLPPVNLSESDDSSGDEMPAKAKEEIKPDGEPPPPADVPKTEAPAPHEPAAEGTSAMNDVWDGVLVSLEKKERNYPPDSPFFNLPMHKVTAIMLGDHCYCRPSSTAGNESKVGIDHDYCNNGSAFQPEKRSPRKSSKRRNRSSSSESSSSSSSSCSCGSNCSCSSSSSSTESATSGEPRPRKKTPKSETKNSSRSKASIEDDSKPDLDVEAEPNIVDVGEARILETDLETDEPVTEDDDFYEKNPALRASEVLSRNRSLLLDRLESTPRPSQMSPRRSSKKKRSSGHSSGVKPLKIPIPIDASSPYVYDEGTPDSDGRRPRRKRVPLKFYGFSSGEEEEGMPMPRKRDRVLEHNTTTPAPPEPAPAAPPSPEPSNLWNPPSWRPPPVVPRVNPIKIRTGSLKQTFAKSVDSGEFTITRAEFGGFHVNGGANLARGEKLYCFCQCPYDEVSEMIACDATDCRIEWFHFECVGIMVPPKGKWYCPDCKKKAAAESELLGLPHRPV